MKQKCNTKMYTILFLLPIYFFMVDLKISAMEEVRLIPLQEAIWQKIEDEKISVLKGQYWEVITIYKSLSTKLLEYEDWEKVKNPKDFTFEHLEMMNEIFSVYDRGSSFMKQLNQKYTDEGAYLILLNFFRDAFYMCFAESYVKKLPSDFFKEQNQKNRDALYTQIIKEANKERTYDPQLRQTCNEMSVVYGKMSALESKGYYDVEKDVVNQIEEKLVMFYENNLKFFRFFKTKILEKTKKLLIHDSKIENFLEQKKQNILLKTEERWKKEDFTTPGSVTYDHVKDMYEIIVDQKPNKKGEIGDEKESGVFDIKQIEKLFGEVLLLCMQKYGAENIHFVKELLYLNLQCSPINQNYRIELIEGQRDEIKEKLQAAQELLLAKERGLKHTAEPSEDEFLEDQMRMKVLKNIGYCTVDAHVLKETKNQLNELINKNIGILIFFRGKIIDDIIKPYNYARHERWNLEDDVQIEWSGTNDNVTQKGRFTYHHLKDMFECLPHIKEDKYQFPYGVNKEVIINQADINKFLKESILLSAKHDGADDGDYVKPLQYFNDLCEQEKNEAYSLLAEGLKEKSEIQDLVRKNSEELAKIKKSETFYQYLSGGCGAGFLLIVILYFLK